MAENKGGFFRRLFKLNVGYNASGQERRKYPKHSGDPSKVLRQRNLEETAHPEDGLGYIPPTGYGAGSSPTVRPEYKPIMPPRGEGTYKKGH